MATEPRRSPFSRRRFVQGAGVAGLGLMAGCGRLSGQAARAHIPRVGVLSIGPAEARSAPPPGSLPSVFQDGLSALGYVDGENIVLDWRLTDRGEARLQELAAELAEWPVDVLVAGGPGAIEAARHATTTIPIVFMAIADPVGEGLVASLARPGGNVTGVANAPVGSLIGKQLELFQEVVPRLTRVAYLRDTNLPSSAAASSPGSPALTAAQALGLQLHFVDARSSIDFRGAFEAAIAGHVQGMYNSHTPMLGQHDARIAELAFEYRLPVMGQFEGIPRAGGLMSYGVHLPAVFRRGATYVDKILKGTSPADLPIEQPTIFDFAINLQTAQALGLTIPPHVLLQATEVIQ